jgi:outer membrane protein
MKRWLGISIGIFGVLLLAQGVRAADTGKIAVVDLQVCVRDTIEGKRLFETLKKTKDDMQKKLDARQEELLKFKDELDKQGMMLSLDAREDKEKEFERRKRELKYYYEDLTEEMRKQEAEARNNIVKEIEKIVSDIGAKGGYRVIMERRSSGIMYFDKAIDITPEVTKAYDDLKRK